MEKQCGKISNTDMWGKKNMLNRLAAFCRHELPFYKKRITKKYYIIRRSAMGAGFFSNYCWVMGHIVFARKLGYIPVVDMLNYKTLYSEDIPVNGEENAWNYYFENVGGVGLKEAYASKRYVMAEDKVLHKYAEKYCDTNYRFPSAQTIDYYYPVIKHSMRIKENIWREFESDWNKSIGLSEHVLGVHVRGTDMRNDLGHPVPAAVDKYIEKAKEIIENHENIGRIFLATDEEDVICRFKEEFQKLNIAVVVNDAFRVKNDPDIQIKKGLHETKVENPRTLHKYRMGLEVLKDAWFLAKCDYLLCGHSNITNVVIIWNNHAFKDVVCLENS